MREIRTSGSMSGDGKRGAGHRPQATAPILDSTADSDERCVDTRLSQSGRRYSQCHGLNATTPCSRASSNAAPFVYRGSSEAESQD